MSIFIFKITTILLHSANLQRVPALLRRKPTAPACPDAAPAPPCPGAAGFSS